MLDLLSLFSLDIETAPTVKTDKPYALEPYRVLSNEAKITSVAIASDQGSKQIDELGVSGKIELLTSMIYGLHNKQVVCHNTIFDTAFIIAWIATTEYGHLDRIQAISLATDKLRPIQWHDTMLAAKWYHNSQDAESGKSNHHGSNGKFSYSLANLVATHLPDHPLTAEFLDVKGRSVTAGEDYDYWLKRGRMDAKLTRDLLICLVKKLEPKQLQGYLIEQRNLLPLAKSWLIGLYLDKDANDDLRPRITRAKKFYSEKLNKPEGMFTSPKQLSHYLFTELGLQPISKTPTGNPCTSKDDLMMMALKYGDTPIGEIIRAILDFKQVKTLESKFINGIEKVCAYNGENINHSAPRVFGTYTGRFTYSSKTLNKEAFRIGIATHQLPRKGPTRKLIVAPEGYMVGELDAAAQELRGIGLMSRDEAIINGFNSGMDLHGAMAAYIAGEPYEPFIKRYHEGDKDAENFRYAGKLLNLSCQYRIGNKALAHKFFTTYKISISQAQAAQYLRLYKSRYRGVVDYWDDAIHKAKTDGYAETIGGRRYGITEWGRKSWASESSAINFPIQGFGADHKNVAIASIFEKFPEPIFVLDLHDGLWYYVPEEHGKELLLEMRDYVSNLPYDEIWDAEIPLSLPFDAQYGTSFGTVKEIN